MDGFEADDGPALILDEHIVADDTMPLPATDEPVKLGAQSTEDPQNWIATITSDSLKGGDCVEDCKARATSFVEDCVVVETDFAGCGGGEMALTIFMTHLCTVFSLTQGPRVLESRRHSAQMPTIVGPSRLVEWPSACDWRCCARSLVGRSHR